MKALLISSCRSMVDEIVPLLEADARDYSSNLVVFPGRRPAHFLRKALAEKAGGSFIPPVILSMDEFINSMYERQASGRRLEAIDAVSLLYDIHRKAKEPLGRDSFMTPDSFFPIGLKIYRDIEELYIEGISLRQVTEIQPYADEGIPEQTLKRLQSLAFFYNEFYKTAGKLGFSTRSIRYCAVSAQIEEGYISRFRQKIFAGFFALTRCEKEIFKKILACDDTIFLFGEGPGMREKIEELGISPEEVGGDDSGPEAHFYKSPDTHGQVYGLSAILQSMIEAEGAPDERTAIVLPSSDTLFPLLRQGLGLMDVGDYNISLGYPLHRTPVFGFLNNLMELITSMDGDRIYLPDYLRFVLHPYTKNIYLEGSAEITRIMFHAMEDELTKNRTRTFLTLSDIENNNGLFQQILEKMPKDEKGITEKALSRHLRHIHRITIERFLSFENVKDFAQKCAELLTYIYNNSTARLHPLFHPFAESFIRSLELISRSLMSAVAFSGTDGYFTFFRKYLMTCHSPFEGTPIKGLQVLGFLETRNLRFDRVFVLDANEETLPDTKKEDTLLPLRARLMLGLQTYEDRDRLAAYYFDTLLKGAKEAHLFFIENDRKERSRFLERLLWERQKADRTTDAEKYLRPVRYRVVLRNDEPGDIMKTDSILGYLRDFTYSATALDTYLNCPLQFYYSYVLKIGRKDEFSGEIERADIGKFVHRTISEYFSKRTGFLLKESDINLQEMEALAVRFFEEEYGREPSGAVYLLRRQIFGHLRDLLIRYYLPLLKRESVMILKSEQDIRIKKDRFSLKGRIDSIEKRGEKTCIIDYKTGSDENRLKVDLNRLDPEDRSSWAEAIGSLQLPFYLMLYSEATGAAITDLNAMFLLLGRSVISSEIEVPLFKGPDPGPAFALLSSIILRMLHEINNPEVPFMAAKDKKKACQYCDFQKVCGTQWVLRPQR